VREHGSATPDLHVGYLSSITARPLALVHPLSTGFATKHVREQLAQDCYLAAELKHRFRFNAIIKDCIKINHIIMTTESTLLLRMTNLSRNIF